MEEAIKCKNCGNELKGAFCHNCGEKIIGENDFSMLSLIKLSFSTITNFDSKFFKTFTSLLFKPGHLTSEFILGKRKSYMQPFQVFVVANLFFFFFLTSSDVFRNPSQWFFEQPGIKKEVETLATVKNITRKEVALIYDNQSISLSKSAVLVIIPFIGIAMWLINPGKKYLFGKHLIFSTHLLSFLMIFMVLLSFVISILPFASKYLFQIPILLVMIFYLLLSQITFYKDSLIVASIKSVLCTAFILIIILLYREIISIVSFYLIK